jgi:hypothetical protein
VPSLDQRFAESKSLIDAVSGQNLITFTRASSGMSVGSNGVLQTAVTNLLLRSEEFDDAAWSTTTSNVSVTSNTDTAPNGTQTADTLDFTNASSFRYQQLSTPAGTTYTFSVWLASKTKTQTVIRIAGTATGTGGQLVVDLTPTLTRYSLTVTIPAGNTASNVGFENRTGVGGGNGSTGTIIAWGAQLEQSSTVGPYIPTTSTINSAPRFDHNPLTGECLGLLVEEQRTNLLLQSENFGTTWSANGLLAFGSGSTLNASIAPDGQTTADLITENTSNSQHNVNQVSTTTGAKRFSVFAKQGPGNRLLRLVDFNATDGAQGQTSFNLSTGAVVSGPGTIQALPNGWYRCSIQSTTTVTSTYFISFATSALEFVYTGDGASGIYIWGAQLEAGAFPTSYIPTTATAVTRSADVASITGANFSSWYRQDEGSLFADASVANSAAISLFSLDDNSTNNRIQLRNSNLSADIRVVAAGSSQATLLTSNATTVNARARHAAAYRLNDLAVVLNSGTVATQLTALLPVATQATLTTAPGSALTNGTIRRLTYWPQRLPNSTLQNITL